MKKWTLGILISLVFFSYITSASTVSEFTFADKGFKDLYIIGENQSKCGWIDFPLPDVNGLQYSILSLGADVPAVERGKGEVSVFINEYEITRLHAPDFSSTLARIEVPQEKFAAGKNTLKVCGTTSELVKAITIYSSSKLGFYQGAYFPSGRAMSLELETYEGVVGVPFSINAVARNYGNEDATANITYRKEEFEENTPEVSVLTGETSKTGIVPKCLQRDVKGFCTKPGEYSIKFTIVANKAVPFTLLPAVLEFTNTFGENQKIVSNRPNLRAIDPPQKVAAKVFLDDDKLYVGNTIEITVRVQNVVQRVVQNIVVIPDTGLEILDDGPKVITSLGAGQYEDVVFSAKAPDTGNYAVGCIAKYDEQSAECETTVVSVQKGIGAEVLVSIVFALISGAVFAYFYLQKDEQK